MLTARPSRPSWTQRSRNARKPIVFGLKKRIAEDASRLGGLYTSDHAIHECSWADIEFLARRRKGSFYNGTVDSALCAYFSECDSRAWEASMALCPAIPDADGLFGPDHSAGQARQAEAEAERRAFGGLRRGEWVDAEAARLADSGDVWVCPEIRLDFGYRHGIGLLATLPIDILDPLAIDAFVADFLARGECESIQPSIKLSYPASRARESKGANALSTGPWPDGPSLAALALARQEADELRLAAGPRAQAGSARAL